MDLVYKCSYCDQQLLTLQGVVSHVQRSHYKPAVYRRYKNLDIPLQCDIVFCNKVCDDIKHFFKHFDVGTTILCPSLTLHLSRYHKSDTVDEVPAELIQIQNEFQEPEYDTDDYGAFDPDSLDAIEVLEETDNIEGLLVQDVMFFT